MNKLEPDFDVWLGSRVRDVRKRYEWTQEELAAKLHMSQHNLSRYETGEYSLTAKHLANLSVIFAITIDSWFASDEAWPNFVRQL